MTKKISKLAIVLGLAFTALRGYGLDSTPFRVEMNDLSFTETYRWNSKTGGYDKTNEVLKSTHKIQGDQGQGIEPPPQILDLGGNPNISMSLYRQGQVAELRAYVQVFNSRTEEMEAMTLNWALNLIEGTWQDFDAGKTVKAEFEDQARDRSVTQSIFEEMALYYYFHYYQYELQDRNRSLSGEYPTITVENVKPTKVLLNKESIGLRMEAEKGTIEADIILKKPEDAEVPPVSGQKQSRPGLSLT